MADDEKPLTGAQSWALAFGVIGVLAVMTFALLGQNYLVILAAGCR